MILRDDHDADWTAAADSTLDRRVYHCQNWRADVVALLDASGAVVERVRYGPYGTPYGGSPADLTGPNNSGSDLYAVPDGDADTDDDNYYQDAYNNGNTNIADISGGSADGRPDGSVTSADFLYWNDIYAAAETLGRNRLSRSDLRNRRGYAGYAWDPALEAATPAYHVRNRVLMPGTGRWNRRDPLGYVDGENLYRYASLNPVNVRDSLGLDTALFGRSEEPEPKPDPCGLQSDGGECVAVCRDNPGAGGKTYCVDSGNGQEHRCCVCDDRIRDRIEDRYEDPSEGRQEGQEAVIDCVEKHEQTHRDEQPCPSEWDGLNDFYCWNL